ncbi:MAG TPA: glutamate racemase [candidate division Zixibacteria bacterium]|nr:glutamate racemase [candidate division Zixibacteria bacterium]
MARAADARPIGVFDSGVGGLTVLSELRRRLPDESTVYLGDNARTPYGPRPADEVQRFTREGVDWLLRQDIKLLVLACNTATARALPLVREQAPVPVLGVVRPGAVTAAAATRAGHVGVIATAGTVESGAYPSAITEADPHLVVSQQACPDLVPLVEAGQLDGPETERAVAGYLGELLGRDPAIDTLLLGCTHYPLLRPVIERTVGPRVAVVDSAFTTAIAAEDLLDALGLRAAPDGGATHRVATTGDVAAFRGVAERLFGASLPNVEAVELAPV